MHRQVPPTCCFPVDLRNIMYRNLGLEVGGLDLVELTLSFTIMYFNLLYF